MMTRLQRRFDCRCLLLQAILVVLVFGSGVTSAFAQAQAPTRPNILVILADDMGWGDPGCYNRESKTPTPKIDRLASQGMLFTDAHSPCSVCVPTRYALLTGRWSFRMPKGRVKIPETEATIANYLAEHGYVTQMCGKWHLGHSGPERPTERVELPGGPVDRGFQGFYGIPASLDIPPYYWIEGNRPVAPPTEDVAASSSPGWSAIQGAFWRAGGIAPGFKHEDVLPTITEKTIDWIRTHRTAAPQSPFFMYMTLPAPHTPWLPAEEFRGRGQAGMYGEFVAQVDDSIGRVLATLDELNIANDTLVILSSDNGPVWFPEDAKKYDHSSTGPWRGMKGDAWEGGHRVPLVVRWPGRVEAGSRSDALVSQVDLFGTLAGIVGERLPATAVDTQSFLPTLLGLEDTSPRRTLVAQSSAGVEAIRLGNWKWIPQLGSGGFSSPRTVRPEVGGPTSQLYDLASDPGETTNLALQRPEVVEQMQQVWKDMQAKGR
jgi:arylsulfatase A-like enzyme